MKKGRIVFLAILLMTIFGTLIHVNANTIDVKIEIDNPYINQSADGILNYKGWVMSELTDEKIRIYIDGELKEEAKRIQREDVLKAISGYGGRKLNPTPGYYGSIDISQLTSGSHTFKVEVVKVSGTEEEIVSSKSTNFNVKEYVGKMYIDEPNSGKNVKTSLYYQGWALSDDQNASIEIYVDDKLQSLPKRYEREDVLKAISGYGGRNTNPTPGYKGTIDTSKLKDGIHKLRVVLKSSNGKIIKEMSTNFNVKKYDTKIEIDKPIGKTVYNKENIEYQGWIMSEDKNAEVRIYIDDALQTSPERYKREDVLKAISGYGGRSTNSTPGYRGTIDYKKFTEGTHTFKVEVVTKLNENEEEIIKTSSTTFTLNKYNTKIEIDNPYINQSADGILNYKGWVMSELTDEKIRIYIDGELKEEAKRIQREDVLKAISGYGGRKLNPTPGYYGSIDISQLTSGSHTFKVEVVKVSGTEEEIVSSKSTNFNVKEYVGKMYIDEPNSGKNVKTSLYYQGWALSDDQNASIEIYVDDKLQSLPKRYEREDVLKAISGYGGRNTNPTPGYKGTIDTSKLKDGIHKLRVVLKSSNGKIIKEMSTNFNVKKYDTKIEIDKPIGKTVYNKENIEYQGWIMSEDKNAEVRIYIDDALQTSPERYKREDVLKAISGYGGRSTNSTPGYRGTIDYKKFTEGTHTFKVEVVTKLNENEEEIIKTSSTTFTLKKYDTKIEIDSPLNNSISKMSIDIQGWIMSEDKNIKLSIYIDNKEIESNKIIRYERDDVLQAINGYGGRNTNPTPGYKTSIDSSNMTNGNHTLKVRITSSESEEIYKEYVNSFTIKKYDGKMYLDEPIGSNFSSDISIRGWEISEYKDSIVKFFIDNKVVNTTIQRNSREDVWNYYENQYGGRNTNSTPEYQGTILITNYSEGIHTLKIGIYSKLGNIEEEIVSYSKQIFISKGRYYGVDVSYHNGDVDWKKMRSNGIDYAFIRAGYRGYSFGALTKDIKFEKNIVNASNAGIKCGVYFFSQAMNAIEGIEEANYLINTLLPNYKQYVKLPIVIDTEYSNENHDGRADYLSKQQRTEAVKGFVDTVRSYGYTPMIYASTDWLNNNLDMSQIHDVEVWVAQWADSVKYNGPYQVWQYKVTDNGFAYGSGSQRLDLDYFYKKY